MTLYIYIYMYKLATDKIQQIFNRRSTRKNLSKQV